MESARRFAAIVLFPMSLLLSGLGIGHLIESPGLLDNETPPVVEGVRLAAVPVIQEPLPNEPPAPVAVTPVVTAPNAIPQPKDERADAIRLQLIQRALIQALRQEQAKQRAQRTKAAPEYVIGSGLYRQRQAPGAAPRYLLVNGEGKGQLILHFNTIERLFVGAAKVVIETTWEVDEADDDVTFTLHGGSPRGAYQNVLQLALEEVARFHIDDFQQESLILRRITDGEVFHWERTQYSEVR